MFNIGDSIAYPMHGAGVITEIEEKEVLGECCSYYHVSLPYSKMHVMVPVENSDKGGVRAIICEDDIDEVLNVLASRIRCRTTGTEGSERTLRDSEPAIYTK